MRAPVRSSLANRGAEPSRQARESVHFSKNEKKTEVEISSKCYQITNIMHKIPIEIGTWDLHSISY